MRTCYWPRAVVHVDMNAFFAAIEQRDFPALRGRPVGVTNGMAGTTLITCSYEARAFGVKTGMRLAEARRLCPALVRRPARPEVYAAVSARIMQALAALTPDIEVFSVDEAFLDVTHCQRLYGPPEEIGRRARALVAEASGGLPCSIGVAATKLVAKLASEEVKPNGFTVVPPWETRAYLERTPAERLCGIGPRVAEFLARYGVRTCGDVARLPLNLLVRRYGVRGKQLWLACQGRETEAVTAAAAPPKSVGHGKVLPPHTRSRRTLEIYLRHMCEKVAARLRRSRMQAGRLFIALRCAPPAAAETLAALYDVPYGTPDGRAFFEYARRLLAARWRGEAVTHVQVTALKLRAADGQLALFAPATVEERLARRLETLDRINARYGAFTLAPATLLERSTMPDVIAPSWRPQGHRRYI
jgi:DNA polymerase-4